MTASLSWIAVASAAGLLYVVWGLLMQNANSFVQFLLSFLALACLTAWVNGLALGHVKSVPYWAAFATGTGLAWLAYNWPRLTESFGPAVTKSAQLIATNAWVWVGLIVIFLLYVMTTTIVVTIQRDKLADVIEKDIIPFRMALQKWVVPRRLNERQVSAIADYLRVNKQGTLNVMVNRRDIEASEFARDLRNAFSEGGWFVNPQIADGELDPGLRLAVRGPGATNSPENDPRNPSMEQLLREALRRANVRIDGSSRGGGPVEDKLVLTLQVGQRRDGAYAEPQEWPF